MSEPLTRREALKRLGTSSAGLVLARSVIRSQSSDIIVAGKPVEIIVSTLGSSTVRLTVLPIESGRAIAVPVDGALRLEGKERSLSRCHTRERFAQYAPATSSSGSRLSPRRFKSRRARVSRCSV